MKTSEGWPANLKPDGRNGGFHHQICKSQFADATEEVLRNAAEAYRQRCERQERRELRKGLRDRAGENYPQGSWRTDLAAIDYLFFRRVAA